MKGVLLINLGSPESTEVKDVRTYLDEFLMDERVIDIPFWKRWLLIKGIILRTRPKQSAAAYKKIWWKEGSPLVVISERFTKKVQENTEIPVALAMRYGTMTIKKGFQELADKGVDNVLIVPLYPHFAMSSTETVLVKAEEVRKEFFPNIKTTEIPHFYNEPRYIKAMSDNIKNNLEGFDYDHILFSYHGIPERHILKTDPTKSHCKIDGSCCEKASKAHDTCYRHQCFETTKEIVKELGLKEGTYSNSFQSRLLKDPWLKPYTDFEFDRIPKEEGKRKMAVVTPAFVADCLETLEEIAMEGEEIFHEVGGEDFTVIPCLNEREDFAQVLTNIVEEWATTETITA